MEAIEFANTPQPLQSPRLQLRPALAHTHKVAADMRPAECQDQQAILHLSHCLVRAVAIDHQHATGPGGVMIFWNVMTSRYIQDVHHRIVAAEGPQPPTEA